MYSIYCAGYQLRATVPCTLVTLYHVTSASERLSTSGDRGPCTGICHLKVQFLCSFCGSTVLAMLHTCTSVR